MNNKLLAIALAALSPAVFAGDWSMYGGIRALSAPSISVTDELGSWADANDTSSSAGNENGYALGVSINQRSWLKYKLEVFNGGGSAHDELGRPYDNHKAGYTHWIDGETTAAKGARLMIVPTWNVSAGIALHVGAGVKYNILSATGDHYSRELDSDGIGPWDAAEPFDVSDGNFSPSWELGITWNVTEKFYIQAVIQNGGGNADLDEYPDFKLDTGALPVGVLDIGWRF